MTDTTPPAVWVDGDLLMEAIAAAVWEQCRTDYPSSVVDDPRNIAAVAATVARTLPAPAVVPAAGRAALSARLWKIAEHHIVAEWICCEPVQPGHDLCAQGYAALGMVKTLLVDGDPGRAWNPSAPLLDAVLGLPAPADRAAEEHSALKRAHVALAEQAGRNQAALARVRRLHDALDAETDLTSPDHEITRGAAARKIAAALDGWTDPAEVRRLAVESAVVDRVAAETPPAETEAQPPLCRWRVETRDGLADQWAPGSPYLSRQQAVERYEALSQHHPAWRDGTPVERRITRETTTYTVEEPDGSAVVAQPGKDTETP